MEAVENKIKNIKYLEGLIDLEKLDLSSNEITNILSLTRLSQLRELEISCNHIPDFQCLRRLNKLKLLDLSFNQISNIFNDKNSYEYLFLSLKNITNWDKVLDRNPNLGIPVEVLQQDSATIARYLVSDKELINKQIKTFNNTGSCWEVEIEDFYYEPMWIGVINQIYTNPFYAPDKKECFLDQNAISFSVNNTQFLIVRSFKAPTFFDGTKMILTSTKDLYYTKIQIFHTKDTMNNLPKIIKIIIQNVPEGRLTFDGQSNPNQYQQLGSYSQNKAGSITNTYNTITNSENINIGKDNSINRPN